MGFPCVVNSAQESGNELLQRLLRDDNGATAIEYGLIAALIAVAAVTVLGTVGTNLTTTFGTVASNL